MPACRRNPVPWSIAVLLLAASSVAGQQERFGEQLEVRETSVVVVPPRPGASPATTGVEVLVDGLTQRITRVEPTVESGRGQWEFLVYLDPQLAGARTRMQAALALAQRAEELAALGSLRIWMAEEAKPELERSGDWQRIEAGLLQQALAARHRLDRGDRPSERPTAELFRRRLERLLVTLGGLGGSGPRVLFLPADGLEGPLGGEVVARLAAAVAAYGWVTAPMPWSERPSEQAAARLSEFERWRESAEGRDVGAGGRRYVIDFGRVARWLAGAGAEPQRAAAEPSPELAALQGLAAPSSGRLLRGENELHALLGDLARRWRIWFQHREPHDGRLRPLEVRWREDRLAAPRWLRSATPEVVAESRLRLALAGSAATGGLAVEATLEAAEPPLGQLTVSGEGETLGPLRLSWTFAPGTEIRHQLWSPEVAAAAWSRQVDLELPPGASGAVVLVEELSSGRWGLRRLELD